MSKMSHKPDDEYALLISLRNLQLRFVPLVHTAKFSRVLLVAWLKHCIICFACECLTYACDVIQL